VAERTLRFAVGRVKRGEEGDIAISFGRNSSREEKGGQDGGEDVTDAKVLLTLQMWRREGCRIGKGLIRH